MSNASYKFTVELSAPLNPLDIPAYCEKFIGLFKYTNSFSIASHATSVVAGFDRSYNLSRYLLAFKPSIELLFHITCNDINKVNIHSKMSLLRMLKIEKILVVTGENYLARDARYEFSDSSELIHHISENFGQWFKLIAVGGYPERENQKECDRLLKKISLVETKNVAIFTQCLFESEKFGNFDETMTKVWKEHNNNSELEIVPSIALFYDDVTLEKVIHLTRVELNHNFVEKLAVKLKNIQPVDLESYSKSYFVNLCTDLIECRSNTDVQHINICTFGLFSLAEQILETLTSHRIK